MTENTEIKDYAREMLEKFAPKGSTVFSIVRTVAKSGMSRTIDFYAINDDEPVFLTGYICNLLGLTRTENGARVHGAGMDMCFATVYEVAQKLYGHGYTLNSETF